MYRFTIKKVLLALAGLCVFVGCESSDKIVTDVPIANTICNPINLSYRFMPDGVSRREAADPTVVIFKGEYYLFASKSGGYWYSADLTSWSFVETQEIPTEEYAPTAIVLGDTIYFLASSKEKSTIYKSEDPKSGHWEVAKEALEVPVWDPAFFLDDDNKLYLYWGCSNVDPIYGVELDQETFEFKGEVTSLIFPKPETFGWEIRGDYNTRKDTEPWLEGAWVNKVNDTYYLQYSAPGTLEKSYCDGVYVADNPLGPYTVQTHNPFASKPEGFACGGGHGNTFEDLYGNYWHVGTITVSVKDKFERRIAMYPTFFDAEGVLYSDTTFGDFPMIIPKNKVKNAEALQPNWMLLSYEKPVQVSSTLKGFEAVNACDEEIRSYWSAQTGEKGEWLQIDLEQEATVQAIQVNFAEQDTELFGRMEGIFQQYVVEVSKDGKQWELLIDKSNSQEDAPHDYMQLEQAVATRFIRVTNHFTPSGKFAISDLRVFGSMEAEALQNEFGFEAVRNKRDRREVTLTWESDPNAIGYQIKFGVAEDKLYRSYQVLEGEEITIRSLSVDQKYVFRIDRFNEQEVRKGTKTISID